jgi:hypothetical protein
VAVAIVDTSPYPLTADAERAVVYFVASSEAFWATVGGELDPKLFPSEPARMVVAAARAVALERKSGCSNPLLVQQRMRLLVADGKYSFASLRAASAYLSDAEDAVRELELRVDDAVQLAVPIVQQRLRTTLLDAATETYGKQADPDRVREALERYDAVGVRAEAENDLTLDGLGAAVAALSHTPRLRIGVGPIDDQFGGLASGQLGLFVGGTGSGKSMCLSHVACEGVRQLGPDELVAYATLELPALEVWVRVLANLTRTPTDLVKLDVDAYAKRVKAEFGDRFVLRKFQRDTTPFAEVARWVAEKEQERGRKVSLMLTDYGDILRMPGKKGEENLYSGGKAVFGELRAWVEQRAKEQPTWHWSASQARRQDATKKRGVLGSDDLADSQHKARIADVIITVNRDKEAGLIAWHMSKVRDRRDGYTVGPIPDAYERGSVCDV